MSQQFDLVILGAGSAGYAAACEASRLGLKVAMIGEKQEFVGHCILHGCMPGKVFVEAADHRLHAERAQRFGVKVSGVAPSPELTRERKEELVKYFAEARLEELENGPWQLFKSPAEFVDSHTVELSKTQEHLSGRTFLIATGSQVSKLPITGLSDVPYMTSDTLVDTAACPDSLVILGGGAVALEAAHYCAAFGSKITILQRGAEVLTRMDADLAAFAARALRKRGVRIICNAQIQRVAVADRHKCVYFDQEGSEQSVEADEILYALGREPRFGSLRIERAGVAVKEGRIAVDTTQQTTAPHIFAAGDVSARYPVLNHAVREGTIAGHNAAMLVRGEPAGFRRMDFRTKLYALFTHPQLASVGLMEHEAQAARLDVDIATYPFGEVGKAVVLDQAEGLAKIIVDRSTRKLLGAGLAGPLASELIHIPATIIHLNGTVDDLAEAPFYHPTLAEIWSSVAEKLVSPK